MNYKIGHNFQYQTFSAKGVISPKNFKKMPQKLLTADA